MTLSQNAYKHGLRSAEAINSQREATQELRELRSQLKDIEESTKNLDIEGLQETLKNFNFG